MLTATITNVSDDLDTVSVFDGGKEVASIVILPDGKAVSYESALTRAGFQPVAFDGAQWTVERV